MSKQQRKSTAKTISESARQIWLAGLGAFAKAQAEGSRVFEQLIREGAELDQKTRKYTKEQVASMRDKMNKSTERLLASGRSTMDKVHGAIDDRVAQAVERMAVPTREELSRMADQLEALSARLEQPPGHLGDAPAKKTRKAATRAPRKSATKTTAKRSASGTAANTRSATKTTRKSAASKSTVNKAKPAAKTVTRSTGKTAAKKAGARGSTAASKRSRSTGRQP